MNSLALLGLGALVLVVAVLALVLPALLRRSSSAENDMTARRANIAMARERLADMRANSAELDAANVAEYEQEIQAQLLVDTAADPKPGRLDQTSVNVRDWLGAAVVTLVLVVVVPLVYVQVGEPAVLNSGKLATTEQGTTPKIEELIARLEERVAIDPDNVAALSWLGRTMIAQRRYVDAADYFARASSLQPEQAELRAAHIHALILAGDQGNLAQLDKLLADALATYADDPAILWVAGLRAERQSDTATAVAYWKKALTRLDDDPNLREQLVEVIAVAEAKLGATNPSGGLEVVVDVAPQFADSTDRLFVFAKASGSEISVPLAVKKFDEASYPLTVHLDDSAAMDPALKMSGFALYDVVARMSGSGNAAASTGDRYGEALRVVQDEAVTVVITNVVP